VVGPGLTQTELAGHQQPAVQERMAARFSDVEIVIRPTDQV
jgi:hypothetical protein